MRVSLSEIWNFADIIKNNEKGLSFSLHTGDAVITGINRETLQLLRDDNDFDTELLPEIFTFRDILWQPDIYTDATMSLPSLRVLHAYCREQSDQYESSTSEVNIIYAQLLRFVGNESEQAINSLELENPNVKSVLGNLRKNTFPIIKFFIGHPRNRLDYYRDSVNRLNYAVKIIITQFNGKYTELQDPYWEVLFDKKLSAVQINADEIKKPSERIEKG
ncbi:MAG: hypothetical protein ACJA08_000570 [Cyclobacteriaceae bacterium]|jgi:hypothetical protein